MQLKVVTKEGIRLEEDVASVILPAEQGNMEVLPGHAGFVALLPGGKIIYDNSVFAIGKGVARILNDEILVLMEEKRGRAKY